MQRYQQTCFNPYLRVHSLNRLNAWSTLTLNGTMGDRIGVQLLVREIYLSPTNHPGQLSLAIPPW